MYIANCSAQVQEFTWRPPEAPRHYRQTIDIGQQILLSGREMSDEDVKAVIEQHRKYGLCSVKEAFNTRAFYGVCYSLDKPVSFSDMNLLVQRYRGRLHDQGRELREQASVATSDFIEQMMAQSQIPETLKGLEVTVEEVSTPKTDDPRVEHGIRVSRDAGRTVPEPKGRRGRARAAA